MKNLTLVIGLSGALAMTVWACGDDVETKSNTDPTTSSGGSGGSGGAVTSSTASSSSSSGAGGFANICDEACNHVEVDCGFGAGLCALAASQLMIDLVGCTDMVATCSADCVVDADCSALLTLAGDNPDPELLGCVSGCQGDACLACVFGSCGPEIQACNNVTTCQAFVQCFQACTEGDTTCYNGCATTNPSAETTALLACANTNCGSECFGAGGADGAGGAGGN